MSSEHSPELRPDLLDDFHAEAEEHLIGIRSQLTALERTDYSAPQQVVLETIFRHIHSLKGLAAMVGLGAAEQVAHATEDFLRPLSRGRAVAGHDELDLLSTVSQQLEAILTAHRQRQAITVPTPLLARLAAATAASARSPGTETPANVPREELAFASAKSRGLALWSCTFRPSRELDQRGVNINAVRARLSARGEILKASPCVRPGGAIEFEFVVGLRHAPEDLPAWAADGVSFSAAPLGESPAPAEAAAGAADAEMPANLGLAPSHLVRVDLNRLDELMRIAGDMVIYRSRLEERLAKVIDGDSELKEINRALSRSLRQLRTAITRMRLVPVAEIFARMPFVVRDLARDSDRQVQLLLEGQQIEIDKFLVERLKEPLLHLVRNAFSHGIEPTEERVALGKAPEGTILLRTHTAGEFVLIDVRDDGRGIDTASIHRRAAELGLEVPQPLDALALLQVLCTPGFSTRAEADRAAGRGVGMSVVFNAVRALGGTMTLETQPGAGTQFTLRLPLTLSIAESIVVSAADQTCAVPQGFIDEILQVPETEVRTIKHAEVIPYRDGVLPLLRLRSLFGAGASERPQFSVLVLSSERGSAGLVVDRVHAQREIIVRPMADPLLQVPGISGATELGDGKPVLILDPIAITNRVIRPRAANAAAGTA